MGNQSLQELIALLNSSSYDQQQSAAIELVEYGGQALSALVDVLLSGSAGAPLAAWALGVIEDPRAIGPLREALPRVGVDVQIAIAKALGELNANDDASVQMLAQLARDSHGELRLACLTALGWLGNGSITPLLLGLLDDPHPETRIATAETLAKLGDARAIPSLIAHLDDMNVWVRQRATHALGKLHAQEAYEALVATLDDSSEWVRQGAVLALADLARPQALPLLIKHLHDDESHPVRRAAALALGILGGDEAVAALVSALADAHDGVVEAADAALARLGYSIDDEETADDT